MAETIISPGVFTRENDLSFVQPAPTAIGTLFVGPTVKGPVEVPTAVTSYGQYQRLFGTTFTSGSTKQEFLTSIAVRNFFRQGGGTALVTRVVSGSFTSATSTNVTPESYLGKSTTFTLQTLGEGTIYNNSTGSADAGTENSDNSLVSGSEDNLRWEVSNVNTSRGTFTLSVRRGNDNSKEKVVLETFNDLSLDPNSPNYIERRIGNQVQSLSGDITYVQVTGEYPNRSNYIRVSSVNLLTLNYVGNDGVTVGEYSDGTSYSASLPQVSSGSFYGATGDIVTGGDTYYNTFTSTNIQGLHPDNYNNVITLLGNSDDYQFNVITAPGLNAADHATQVNSFTSLAETRGDCIFIVDMGDYGDSVSTVAGTADGLNSSYAATYYPFLQVATETGKNEFVPPSVLIPGVYAANDNSSAPWFAPAGLTRGGIPGVLQAERKLSKANRDTLYSSKINPIATFPGSGISVLGQKTLQTRATALDRVNVRRLLIELKNFFSQQARNLLFEQNTIATRNRFLAAVNPYLESVVQRQGLYAYRVVMDDTNNTADVIDRNQLVGQVFIQPSKTAEFIVLDFTVQPTGASFDV